MPTTWGCDAQQHLRLTESTTKDLNRWERLSGSYRNSWLEVELDGQLSYRHSRNDLQSTATSTLGSLPRCQHHFSLPWGMTLATDLHENSRRGYSDPSLNTNELVWNAQLSQSFLRGKPLTVMLQFYDILHTQSNSHAPSRPCRAATRSIQHHSYVMLHVNYRLNLFGGKGMGPGDGRRGPGMGPGRGGRPPMGGFGGGQTSTWRWLRWILKQDV